MKTNEILELEYLRYFFEQATVPLPERMFLEEGFELCFNQRVPEPLRINIDIVDSKGRPTIPPSYDITIPAFYDATTPVVDKILIEKQLEIPKDPKVPIIYEPPSLRGLLLDKTSKGAYTLVDASGKHVSLGGLIDQLKSMTGIK